MSFDLKIKTLELELPEVPKPVGSYVSLVESDGLVFLSGLLPRNGNEVVFRGKVGADLSVEQGIQAARLCALNALSVIRDQCGTLDKVGRILRVVGYIHAHSSFTDHPQVLNGASDLFKDVFGEAGLHARSAVGVASLPANAACEIELTFRIRQRE